MIIFPPADTANSDGLLAVGGNLAPETLLSAYQQGIFPWYMPGQALLWWTPDPRMILPCDAVKISRSLRKKQRNNPFNYAFDTAFSAVVRACRDTRGQDDSWIDDEMISAYETLHQQGHAHSLEVYEQNELVGGLYGVSIGRVFFGESMFHRRSDVSKLALLVLAHHLQAWGYPLIDCQVSSAHLQSLGAYDISRAEFLLHLKNYCPRQSGNKYWEIDPMLTGQRIK